MKFTQKGMYSFDMNEYERSDSAEKTSRHFELNFNQELGTEVANGDDDVEVEELYTQLAQKDRDLMLAAELGKALLEKNEELSLKCEQLTEEYSHRTEKLEQEKHELRLKSERLEGSYESRVHELQADLQLLRKQLRTMKNTSKTDQENKRETVAGLAEENERLHSDLHKVQCANDELKKQLVKFKRQLKRTLSAEETRAQWMEISELHDKVSYLEEERSCLSQSIEDLMTTKDTLTKDIKQLREENDKLTSQLTSSKSQLAGTEEELNESKHLNSFLQEQIDELKMQASVEQTSLFSELSDLSLSMADGDVLHARKASISNLHGSPKPMTSSPSIRPTANSNKRLRKHSSFGDDNHLSIDSEFDGEDETDGPIMTKGNVYMQLKEEEVLSSKLKKEIFEAHKEIQVLYEVFQSFCEGIDVFSVEALDPDKEFKPGCLTSLIRRLREILEDSAGTRNKDNAVVGVPSVEELLNQVQKLEEELKQLESLREDLESADAVIQHKKSEISQLQEKIQEQLEHIQLLKDQREQLALGQCGPQLAHDILYKQAVKDREEAIKREELTCKELNILKEDKERLGQQLMEAIHQKLELFEQLEQWQIDVTSLIDDQVKQQMKTAAKEQQQRESSRTRRKSNLTFGKRWNWPSSPSRRQSTQ